jgi:hypothetical protein
MESCVAQVMERDGVDKGKAIAICRTSIMGEATTAGEFVGVSESTTAGQTYTSDNTGGVWIPARGARDGEHDHNVTITWPQVQELIEQFDQQQMQGNKMASRDTGVSHDYQIGKPTEGDLEALNVVLGSLPPQGEIIAFRNARLAKAERNANGDEISGDNLRELASTMALMPMMSVHGSPGHSRIVGMYTKATVADLEDGMYLLANGVLYPKREPEIVEDIISKRRKQSIEAVSERVECSVCGQTFSTSNGYCEHLQPILASKGLPEGVSRRHYNMYARGAAAVFDPAGTNAGFNDSGFLVIASDLEQATQETEMAEDTKKSEHEVRAEELATQVEALQAEKAKLEKDIADLQAKLEAEAERHNLVVARVLKMASEGMATGDIQSLIAKVPGWDEDTFNLIIAQRTKINELAAGKAPVQEPPAVADGDAGEHEAADLLSLFSAA